MITGIVRVRNIDTGEMIMVADIGATLTEITENVSRAVASMHGWQHMEIRSQVTTIRLADTADLDDALEEAFVAGYNKLDTVEGVIVAQ